jgi:hypothetical protein
MRAMARQSTKPDHRDAQGMRRTQTFVTILQRHPMLGLDHCRCGAEVAGGHLVLVVDDGQVQKVVGCWKCGGV